MSQKNSWSHVITYIVWRIENTVSRLRSGRWNCVNRFVSFGRAYLIVSNDRDLCLLPRVSLIPAQPPDILSAIVKVEFIDIRAVHVVMERKANHRFVVSSSERQYGDIIFNHGRGALDIKVKPCKTIKVVKKSKIIVSSRVFSRIETAWFDNQEH